MSDVEILTDGGRRRLWSAAGKLRLVEVEADADGWARGPASRPWGAALAWRPNLLRRWRRLMLEGGSVAVTGGDEGTSDKRVRRREDRIREIERRLGRKTLEVEVRKGEADPGPGGAAQADEPRHGRPKTTDGACAPAREGRLARTAVAEVLGVSRSSLHDRPKRTTKPRGTRKAQDAAGVPLITARGTPGPTCGYRRITAVLNRPLRADGAGPTGSRR